MEDPGMPDDEAYVVSSTLEDPEWNNSTVLEGDLLEEVTKLRQRSDGDIVVHGSPRLVQTLLEHDLDFLVDDPKLEDELTGELMSVADTIVFGRKSFPDSAAYWTAADGDFVGCEV
jgi:hypothetical protein